MDRDDHIRSLLISDSLLVWTWFRLLCRSWINLEEEDCGRLEFLGDAVLGLIVTSYIFYCLHADSQKSLKPGQLSDLR